MARIVTASAGEAGGQAASCRTIQELLESYTPTPFMDPSFPSATTATMAQRSSRAAMDGCLRSLGNVAGEGEREVCNSVPQGEFSVSLLERLQLPCGLSPSVLPFAPHVIKQDTGNGGMSQCSSGAVAMPDTVSNADAPSAGPKVDEVIRPRTGSEKTSKVPSGRPTPHAEASPAGQDALVSESPSSEWWNGRNSLPELVGDEAASSSSNGMDVGSKFSPPMSDPFATLARVATTTTCSAASTNEDPARLEEVGRVPRVFLEHPAAFPFMPTPSSHVIPASVDTDGESMATEQEGEHQSKLGHGSFGQPRPPRAINVTQPSPQVGGVCPVRSNALGSPGGAEQLLQRVLHAMSSEAVNPAVWDGEQSHLLSDVGRLGGRCENGFTLNGVRAENSESYEQLLGLCAPQISPAVSAWPLLQAGVASPSTGCVGGSLIGGGGILPRNATLGEALPNKSSLWESSVTRESLPSPHLTLLLQAELLRSQELLNGGGGVGGLMGGDVEDLISKVRQLHSVPGISNLAWNGQAQSHAAAPQPHEFPFFCHQGLPVAEACVMGSQAGEACGNTAFALVKPAASGKKVRKDTGFAEPGQKKKARKPKSKDTSRTESPLPGSPKVAPRKRREGTPTSRSGDDAGDSTSATSLANDLHAMAVLANMTEEEAAELEAEAIRRQSNRSRNCPAEVINAVDFTGELIKFAKVIGLHYHPKQNRWLAWRSQKGSKKVFKSFSTKKFGISGARLMALRWRLGHGVGPDDGQDALSDSNEIDETVQSPSGDERDNSVMEPAVGCDDVSDTTGTGGAVSSESPTPVSGQEMAGDASSTVRGAGIGMSDEMSESTATGGPGSSESSTPANDQEMFCDASFPDKRVKEVASGPCNGEFEAKWQSFEKKEALSPVASAAGVDHQSSEAASRLSAPLSSLLSDRLGLLLGSITPAEDLTESDKSRLAALSSQGQDEERILSTPLADIVLGSARSRNALKDDELCSR